MRNSNVHYGLNVVSVKPLRHLLTRLTQYNTLLFAHMAIFKSPKLIATYDKLADLYKKSKSKKVLIVADKTILSLGLTNKLEEALNKSKIKFVYFTDINPNPIFQNVYDGKKVYLDNKCDSIIAIGGGSTMDCAKAIGITITNKKPLQKYKGLFKVTHNIPLLSCIPTTCGTGSETTLAAVIIDEKEKHKYAIESNRIVPRYALLDGDLVAKLPKQVFATTAMDALTHAVESYLNVGSTHTSKTLALKSCQLIAKYIEKGYEGDENARKHILLASFLAGKAFNRSMVGNVHALAHALGGKYNLPHGYLNAIILPVVLTSYYTESCSKMENISRVMGLITSTDKRQNALNLINYIYNLNTEFGLPTIIKEIQSEDIPEMAKNAHSEAVPLYPTPLIYSQNDFRNILKYLQNNDCFNSNCQ